MVSLNEAKTSVNMLLSLSNSSLKNFIVGHECYFMNLYTTISFALHW